MAACFVMNKQNLCNQLNSGPVARSGNVFNRTYNFMAAYESDILIFDQQPSMSNNVKIIKSNCNRNPLITIFMCVV